MFHRGILVRQEYKFRSVSKSSGQLEFLLEIPFRLVHLCRLHLKELVFSRAEYYSLQVLCLSLDTG